MAATPSVVIKKSFAFRGGTQIYANRYHFNGGTPANNTAWDTLFDNIVAAEKLCLNGAQTIVEAVGYTASSTTAAHSKAYSVAGTSSATGNHVPGEVAGLIRYSTAARSVKGHPIYLFNYYHDVLTQDYPSNDLINGTMKTEMETYADAWIAGFSDGTNTYNRAGPQGADATSKLVHSYVTHHDFPR